MGSSAKKRKDKKKDFQRPKLKVGKAKPRASNFTNTSFKAKSIVLNKQSLSVEAPTPDSQFSHHVSLLRSRSDAQRAESLSNLTSAISAKSKDTQLCENTSTLIPKVQKLILDGSPAVRRHLLKFLWCLPAEDVQQHVDELLLHIRAGVNHLSGEMRNHSLEVLIWLLEKAGDQVVSSAGTWVKLLDNFMSLLGWQDPSLKSRRGWTSHRELSVQSESESKATAKRLGALSHFVKAGIHRRDDLYKESNINSSTFPLWDVEQHMLPKKPNAFARLNLFGNGIPNACAAWTVSGSDCGSEDEMLHERSDRQLVFTKRYQKSFCRELERAKKEGGEVGRAATGVAKIIEEGMEDFDQSRLT